MYKTDEAKETGTNAKLRMPTPKGWKILITLPEVQDATRGGVLLPDALKDREGIASIIGFVVSMGPDAYADEKKFPHGPYCKVGDFVIFRSYAGTRFKVDKQEFRLINDDTVEAVVDDPRGYERSF